MTEFLSPEHIPQNVTPNPEIGMNLYVVEARLAPDGQIVNGIRPGLVTTLTGRVAEVADRSDAPKVVAVLRNTVRTRAVAFYLPGLVAIRGYQSFEDSQYIDEEHHLVVGGRATGRLALVADEFFGHEGVFFDPAQRYAVREDGSHAVTRITDSRIEAEILVKAIGASMRLPDEACDWMADRTLPRDYVG